MTLMDGVQILILLLLIALLTKPLYTRWLPARWRGLTQRLLPPRSLKYEGAWQRRSTKTDKEK
ncbi:cellulose biosynthesis protein BcsF [Mixta tenebrionis]|uniref:Cellulose biosynthesis protein BcsF n=1 Tax=Mixta tenebrionis TaxID=2562439 RepID=A0A506V7X3_9GAMM|nr:cellulose biosynthesis protein BcsF [Mixta tenebrionis]TPW41921.1 cellulose biosynthesis protein BcsF [Mixta tenebrionis]